MSFTISPADPQRDRDAILELWDRNLPGACPQRHQWLYGSGRAFGWIARTARGRPIGAAGLMCRTMKLFNETVPAGQAVDLNVDRDHRSVGPALALQRAVTGAVASGLRLLYALPNDRSEQVLRRAGYRVFGQLQRWAKPLRSETLLHPRLRSALVRKPVAAAIDSLLKLRSRETRTRLPRGVRYEQTYRFDARFDALWRAAGPRFPVAGERTAAYLDWRWRQNPGLEHHILSLCDASGQLLAYAVYSRHEATIYLDDFLFLEVRHLECLLAELVRLARRQGAEAVITVYLGSGQVEAALESFGFWRRPGHWNALVYENPGQPVLDRQRLYNPASWHLTRADLDTDFHTAGSTGTVVRPEEEFAATTTG